MFRTERFQVDKDVFVFGNRCGLARDDLFDFDVCRPLADKAQFLRGGFGYVDDAVAVEGPRSLTRTMTLLPFLVLVTRTWLGMGRVLWAAVKAFIS